MSPVNEGIGVFACHSILKWSQDSGNGWGGHVERFVETNEGTEMPYFRDLVLSGSKDGTLTMWRYFKESSLFPDPSRHIAAIRKYVGFLWFDF